MRISALIEELMDIQAEKGDIETHVFNDMNEIEKITEILVDEEGAFIS